MKYNDEEKEILLSVIKLALEEYKWEKMLNNEQKKVLLRYFPDKVYVILQNKKELLR